MSQLRAILVDDEANNLDNLRILLNQYCPQVSVIATAASASDARTLIHELSPDILFLDIRMPGETGFDLLKSLPGVNFEVIFVTAYDQYGVRAIKFSALDYLMKPIVIDELKNAVEKAFVRIAEKQQHRRLDNLLQYLQEEKSREQHKLALSTTTETRFVRVQDILYCRSTNSYTSFYLQGGEVLLVSKPIKEYEELLAPYGFLRAHQSYLVNKEYIKSLVKKDGYYLLMEDGNSIPVSRQKKDYIQQMIR
ncbi:LytR/AlgR family response regulator transcription factor [Chitinophagaceae bacterium MMS25-I14]